MGRLLHVGLVFIFSSFTPGCEAGPDHKKLLSDLLSGYDKNDRPVRNDNDTLEVKFGSSLLNIVELDVAHGYLETNLWISMGWRDYNFKWDPANYGGIDHFSLDPSLIWKPDILLYNSVHNAFDPTYHTSVVIKNDGYVLFVPPGIFRSSCPMDVTYYPYDEHDCILKFGSWTVHGEKLNITMKGEESFDMTSFSVSPDWEVLDTPGKVNSKYYACCSEPYVDVTYTIKLRRRGGGIFGGSTFTLFLGASSIILGLFLPIASGHRINLGVITILALLYMDIGIWNSLNGHASVLGSYFRTLCFLTFMSILTNVFILHFYKRNQTLHKIPIWVKTLFCERLSHFIRLNPSDQSHRNDSISNAEPIIDFQHDSSTNHLGEIKASLQELIQRINGIQHHENAERKAGLNDWQYFAIVLDRLALIIFSLLLSVFFLAFFCQLAIF